MFWTVPLSIIRSFSLYIQQWYMSYRFADCLQVVSKPVWWHISLLCVQWKTPDDGQRNCPKHEEFYSKNEFEKLVHLVGFIIRIYLNAWLPKCQSTYQRLKYRWKVFLMHHFKLFKAKQQRLHLPTGIRRTNCIEPFLPCGSVKCAS